MINLKINNFDPLNIFQSDKIQVDLSVGQQLVTVQNTNGYVPGSFVVVGNIGTDSSELARIDGATGATTVQLQAPLLLEHKQFDRFTILYGDQIKIYRAQNINDLAPDDTAYAAIGTTPIDYDETITNWVDDSGSNDYWYKYTYLNSQTNTESQLSDSAPTRGGGYDTYCTVDEIRSTAGFQNNSWITDADIDVKRREAQAEIDAALNGMYAVPFQPPLDPMITGITRLKAAGKLLTDEYGPGNGASAATNKGQSMLDEADAMLDLIDNRQYILTDSAGNSTLSPNSQSSKSFPDATTPNLSPQQGGSRRNFRMADVQEGTRRY